MKPVRNCVAAVLAWGFVLACACGGSNVLLTGGDGGADGGSSSGSSSGGTSGSGSGSGSSSGSSSGSGSGSGSSSGSSSGGMTCGECSVDSDCSGCTAPPTGSSNCCQKGQGTCYVVPQPTCPGTSSSSGGSGGGSSGSSGGSSGSSGSSSGGAMCGACTTDLQCQLTCPAVQGGGTNCCEASAGICYAVASPTCPLPQDASTE